LWQKRLAEIIDLAKNLDDPISIIASVTQRWPLTSKSLSLTTR
jgi:hypothetical protein